jgi:putative ABC transport system permease protein
MMQPSDLVHVALSSLRATKARAFLTALGIVIGVAAVITTIALGSGAQRAVESQLDALGTDRLSITPGQSFARGVASAERAALKIDDAVALQTYAPNLKSIAPILSGRQQIKFAASNANVDVVATTAANASIERFEILKGRFFTDGEDAQRRRVAVIGADIPTEMKLELPDPTTLVGQEIQVRGVPFEIIGVLAPSNRDGRGDPDETVFIPLNTGRDRVFGTDRLQSITVQLRDTRTPVPAILDIEAALRKVHHLRPGIPNDFRIQDNSQFLAARAEASATMTYLLAGIAAVSLIVGGIGIMNIMLVSVTERTREIGVRKALGATRKSVLAQFLLEAIVLCLTGGIAGVAVGYGASALLARLNGWVMEITPESVAIAVCFSAVVGVFFGVWPARRAAKLDPIEALRYE